MAAKRKTLWQILAAQLLLVAVPLYGLAPELSALASTRGDWEPQTRLRVSSSALEKQHQAIERLHPEIASGDSFHAEAIGTIRALTDEQGNVTDRYTLDAFGTLLDHQGDDPNAYLFAGEPLDPNSGFYYNRARWLSVAAGAFVSADPLASRGDAISLHLYNYADGDPLGRFDPLGEFSLPEGLISTLVQGIIKSLPTAIVSRTIETAQKVRRGADLGTAIWEGAIGVLQDALLDAATPGLSSVVTRFAKLRRVGQPFLRSVDSVWNKPWFKRGKEIEAKILHGRRYPPIDNFPVIDHWRNGVVVSIKSIDLTSTTYNSPALLRAQLRRYARSLAEFQRGHAAGYTIPPTGQSIKKRVLTVAFEPGAPTTAQAAVLEQVRREAESEFGIVFALAPIK